LINNGGDLSGEQLSDRADGENLILISPGYNSGVAAALNFGVLKAIEDGAEYIATFDQDSIVPAGMLNRLIEVANELRLNGFSFSSVSPRYFDVNSGKFMPFYRRGRFGMLEKIADKKISDVFSILTTITSGTIYPISIFKDVGLFEEGLFIDHVDHEWCFRAGSLGYSAYCCWDQVLFHKIGEMAPKNALLGRALKVHRPIRNYYYCRNSVEMISRSYIPIEWRAGIFLDLILKMICACIIWGDKRERLTYIMMGLLHGVRGRFGEFRP
jgi:rhamnosyltransferase